MEKQHKAGLLPPPPYAAFGRRGRGRRAMMRRSQLIKVLALGCMTLLVLAQWKQIWRTETTAPRLSTEKLNADYATCQKLRSKPSDPIGPGREKNTRYIEGGRPTLIKNATIWVGEPAAGTSPEDARAGVGWDWVQGDVLLELGLIQRVEPEIKASSVPEDAIVYNAHGRQLTSGIIDMHSHAGVFSLPVLAGNADSNEASDNITPWARSIDGIWPLDPQIQAIKSGGVTTSLVLPGSANNIGGEAYLIKHAVGPADGRRELGAEDMLADPDRSWRYMKMACGENAKRIHGSFTSRPVSRMGESYEFRHAFEQAREQNQKQDDWCAKAEQVGVENMDSYLPQEIFWESLGAALRGQVHVNVHCYTIPDLEAMVDHTNEFEFPVRAFHHAHQTYLVPEILRRTWGGRAPSSALFADNMYYKAESYWASEFAGKYLYEEGLTPIYVSDNPVLNAQHVLFEAAKGYRYGLPYHAALASVTTAPADDLGMGGRLGKVKPGFDADIVVWDSDPLSVGATPVQVWIDGTPQFEDPFELSKPVSAPIVPDKKLSNVVEEPTMVPDALFSGITKVLLSDDQGYEYAGESFNVAVSNGKISCIGTCKSEFEAASAAGVQSVELEDGYLTNSFIGAAGALGLNEIDGEAVTDNGRNPERFSRAVDGLLLGSKKLHAAYKYGVTRAISAPRFTSLGTHHGTSVGFITTAHTSFETDAIFAEDVAVHYTLDMSIRPKTSYSAAFGRLREKYLKAGGGNEAELPYSEEGYLKAVAQTEMTLALTINSADGIAAALRLKRDADALMWSFGELKLAIIGGAEAYLLADELAEAEVGVILTPLNSMGDNWDTRRALSGAPLTNGTNVDRLLDAGVKVGIGLHEDWEVRDLALAAGTAYKNGEGRLSEKDALDLVSKNILDILHVEVPSAEESGHFVVSEGSPLEIGSRIKAVGSGNGQVAVFV